MNYKLWVNKNPILYQNYKKLILACEVRKNPLLYDHKEVRKNDVLNFIFFNLIKSLNPQVD
jgi:hypothetical protein